MNTIVLPTVGESRLVIDNNFTRYMDGQYIDPIAVGIMGYSVANHLQIRDYLLGLTLQNEAEGLGYISHLVTLVADEYRHAFYAILSANHYAMGDRELASVALVEAQTRKADYSLSNLLARVYQAGWPAEGFMSMTNELHPKVIAEIEKTAENTIENTL